MKKHISKPILPVLLICSMLLCFLNGCSHPGSFEEFTENLFLEEVTSNTINLHYTVEDPQGYGISDYDISLGDFSKKGREKNYKLLQETKLTLLTYPYLSLSEEEQLTYDILSDYLDTQIKLYSYELYEEPLAAYNGLHTQLPILFAEYEFHSEQDVKDYLKLISLTRDYFSQIVDFEKEKAENGLFMSDELCEAVIESCESFVENPSKHYLLTTFENRIHSLDGLSEKKKQSYIEKNKQALTDYIIPAYENLIKELTALLGTGKNELGLCQYEHGKAYYELLVYSLTGCSDSVDEIYNRINVQCFDDLMVCADLQDKDSSIIEKCSGLEWEISSPEEMLSLLQRNILSEFPEPADASCTIDYIDPCLEEYLSPAFYIVAPIDNYTKNRIFLNNSDSHSDIYAFTTMAHEGYPGHLYQTLMTYEYGFEPVRSILDYNGFVEGWATYVEMMSYAYAGLDEDIASMLSHNQSATLSLYATSDIGLHYYGWTSEDMYEFWSSYGITDTDTIDEITRIILSDPGNYLSYYVGYLEFLDLKDYAKSLLGNEFSSVAFHRTLLDIGPAPFDVVEKYFENCYSPRTDSATD
uniref:DUF885 domain-containing protein n=1 Tax=Agathobacter sp. TaxID=2021311 RepID=UPI004056A082